MLARLQPNIFDALYILSRSVGKATGKHNATKGCIHTIIPLKAIVALRGIIIVT